MNKEVEELKAELAATKAELAVQFSVKAHNQANNHHEIADLKSQLEIEQLTSKALQLNVERLRVREDRIVQQYEAQLRELREAD